MPKPQCIRHGEIAFEKIDSLPKGLKQAKTKVIVSGSHGHDHSFDNGKLYFKEEPNFVFGYFVAKSTSLFHEEHGVGGKAEIPDGIYRLHKQHEHTPEGLKPVID